MTLYDISIASGRRQSTTACTYVYMYFILEIRSPASRDDNFFPKIHFAPTRNLFR
jgi:hypothetical protein